MTISNSFINLPLERKEEIRDIAIHTNKMVTSYFYDKNSCIPNWNYKLEKAYAFFKKYYSFELTNEEKNVFYLYILFPDDEYFSELILNYEKQYDRIASLFNLNSGVVRLRYLLQKNITIEKAHADLEHKKTMN